MRPDIQQFIRTLRRQKADYIPLAELGIHPLIKERLIGRPVLSLADDVEFWLKAGYDYVKLQPGVDFNPGRVGGQELLTYSMEGTLTRKWASEGRGIIGSDRELDQYRFPLPSDFDYSSFERVRKILPDGMGVIGQYGDIFTMTWEMMGFETFSMALFENPELVDRLNTTLGNLVLGMFENFAQSDAVDVLWYSDDIAYTDGLLVSPTVLRKYCFSWLRKIGDLARRHGKPFIYHTDGVLYTVMEDLIECGIDALHPIEPKAMSLRQVKDRYGNRLCLIGHVDVDLLARGSTQEVRKQVRDNIDAAGLNGGYCVGSGNSIPEYVNFENYLAMIDETLKIGKN
jgi:uroporphyrinogen decarboxylase